jgi:hypothetical protein
MSLMPYPSGYELKLERERHERSGPTAKLVRWPGERGSGTASAIDTYHRHHQIEVVSRGCWMAVDERG